MQSGGDRDCCFFFFLEMGQVWGFFCLGNWVNVLANSSPAVVA